MAQRKPAKLTDTIGFELIQLRQRAYNGKQVCILPHIKGNGRNRRDPFRLHFCFDDEARLRNRPLRQPPANIRNRQAARRRTSMGGGRLLPPLRLQLQQQVAQLGALAGKARLSSLAHPPPLADLLGARAHSIVPVHHLLEQLGGHARIG